MLTLGNLAIIPQALNSSVRDADWLAKKVGFGDKGGVKSYAEGIETLSPYLELEHWDEGAINSRAGELCDKALEIWGLEAQ